MNKIADSLFAVLDLKIFEGYRTTVVGAAILLLHGYQGFAATQAGFSLGIQPIPEATYTILLGILIERLARFAKKHKNGAVDAKS